ncbi:MAG: hypothetical protein IPP30_04165 [Flavobacterium sp.]|nr:hypothetical protein [Flavobacterium sp.]
MKKYFVLLLLCVNVAIGQTTINQYKYVIVPAQFNFLKEKDQYRLNTLTKLLLEKYGFTSFFDTEELPAGIINSNCDKLYADVISTGNFTRTKLQVILKDCRKNMVYESIIGASKEKEYKVAYTQALRAAFQSFDTLQYHYSPEPNNGQIQKKEESTNNTVIRTETFDEKVEVLYAQPIANGFQLVDSIPKVVMKIFKTSNPNTFSAVKGNSQGVLLLKDDQWFFEYYEEEKLISEKINVKF